VIFARKKPGFFLALFLEKSGNCFGEHDDNAGLKKEKEPDVCLAPLSLASPTGFEPVSPA
jgi:hypothetical protein